jgi:hypothetical protein
MNKKNIALILITLILISSFTGCTILDNNGSVSSDISNKPDLDKDGVPDEIDDFPDDPSASVDSDDDGYPDRWNPGKNQQDSTSNPPLELDEFPNDPDEWKDTDGDRVGDNSDTFPYDPNEWLDTDEDGVGDNSDINPFVNLSFEIKLEKFVVTSKVDIIKWAQVFFDIKINGNSIKKLDDNGKRWRVWLNKVKEIRHDIIFYDIPDDTKELFTNIEIIMYDYDFIGSNDVIDISSVSGQKTLILKLDNKENTIDGTGFTEGNKGRLWYDIILSDETSQDDEFINRIYKWYYKNNNWKVSFGIPVDIYNKYANANVDRSPQDQPFPNDAIAAFVTSNEKVIVDFANELKTLADSKRFNTFTTANFILRFVQVNVEYILDNESHGCIEYWKFPVETLVDKKGDCEDSAILYASIMDALGFDVVLLFYKLEDKNSGHLAVGIHLQGDHGAYVEDDGKKYFYCETTTSQFNIGQLPDEIDGEPKKIIHI